MKFKNWKECPEVPKNITGIVERSDGMIHLYYTIIQHIKNGKFHNENGPALVYSDERKEWYLNGRSIPERYWKMEIEKLKK
jgi:hypothetical protein